MKTTHQHGGITDTMKKILWLLLVVCTVVAKAQNYDEATANKQEVFLQFNRTFYLSGEKLWFTLFNYDSETGALLKGRRFMSLQLLNRNGEEVLRERIKVLDGRTAAQIVLPAQLNTDEYLLHLNLHSEAVEEYLYRKKIKIYNRSEVLRLSENTPIDFVAQSFEPAEIEIGIEATLAQNNFSPKEKIELSLSLKNAKSASLSVLVKPLDQNSIDAINAAKTDYEKQNSRKSNPLNFKAVQDHAYLIMDLKANTALKPEARPFIFIPESHQVKTFFKIKNDTYSVDLTNVPAGLKSFYFNQFTYKPYIPPNATWDYEKEKYKDNLVPYFEGEMDFSWQEPEPDFASVLTDIIFNKPTITEEVKKYAQQQSILEAMYASGGYEGLPLAKTLKEPDPMSAPTVFYRRTGDFEMMDNFTEFLFEIVTGIRAWNTEKRKEVRVMFGGEVYHDPPLFLIDGIPTRDVERVLELPIEGIEGVGVIKYHESQLKKFNTEARPYSAFMGSGIIVVHLKPGVSNPFRRSFEQLIKKRLYLENEAYPNPVYSEESKQLDIPDLRRTLLWAPIYEMEAQQQQLHFYTSDVPGKYEIVVQGISEEGEKIFLRKAFEVSPLGE